MDLAGHPTGNPLTFPSSPETLGCAGQYVVAVCGTDLLVYDLQTRDLVQRLLFPVGQIEAGEERLFVEHNAARTQFLLISSQRVSSPTQVLLFNKDDINWIRCEDTHRLMSSTESDVRIRIDLWASIHIKMLPAAQAFLSERSSGCWGKNRNCAEIL